MGLESAARFVALAMVWSAVLLPLSPGLTSPSSSPRAISTPIGWRREAAPGTIAGAGTYTIALPPTMKSVPVTGVDSYVSEYRSPSLKLLLDFGLYGSSGVTECRQHRSCSVGAITVGGVRASRVHYQVADADGGLPYRTTYSIPFGPPSPRPGGGVTLTVWAECARASACALADRIVRTIEIHTDH